MRPPKRQIIKTRSQRPYVVARLVLALIALVALAVVAALLFSHPHRAHAALQEAPLAGRKAAIQASVERFAHEALY